MQKIIDWLIDGARSAASPSRMMSETCERLVAAGLPLWRVGVFVRTLHPDIYGRNFIWRPGAEVEIGHGRFQYSGCAGISQQSADRSCSREGSGGPRARVDDLRQRALSDFRARCAPRASPITSRCRCCSPTVRVNASSWTTKQPGGFTDQQLTALRALVPALARVIEIIQWRRTSSLLLDTYVGNRAGERILKGQIRRGHTDTMDAAIWLSDLRGFTALSDRLPAETVVDILNSYFDCQVTAIRDHGGEVLKFMGDGLLAVFPIDEYVGDVRQVCGHVLEAARESRASVEAMHYPIGDTVERFRFGVALHVGRILYGNIGGGNRLDFTCIGPAVNLAARLEKIAGKLNRTVVASAGFAGICAGGWDDLGEFPIAGFSRAERVYGLLDEAPRN